MPILCSALCDHDTARARMSIGKRRDSAEGNRRGQSEERVTKENKEIRLLFPTVVQESFIDDAAEVNRALLQAIDDIKAETPNGLPSSWSCTLYTTIESQNALHNLAPFRELAAYITGKANDFAKTLKVRLDDYPLEMRSMWVNVYGKGHSQEIHNHSNSVFSGVYYVKAPPGSPGLLIHGPMADTMVHMPVTEETLLNSTMGEISAEEGKLVMFRSWLKHSVKPSPIDEDRISIAVNFSC